MTDFNPYPDEPASPYVTDEASLLHDIRNELVILNNSVKGIEERMTNVESMTVKVIEEIKPTLDEFMNSSLGKMLGVGKKK